MKLSLNNGTKILLVAGGVALSIYGFMIKLPSAFRHFDKELHSLFYFLAAAGLNILFAKKKITIHLLIFAVLYLFGVAIEYAQEYSNKLLHKKIHGRYDVEDIQSNLKGLIAFSLLWIIYVSVWFVYKKAMVKKVEDNG
jgi:hypothetical protein